MAAKAESLRVFDIDWWLDQLIPICHQFARAAAGDVDRDHWQAICKVRSAYGGDIINGWVAKLFPYLRAWAYQGPVTRRNPIFETGEGFQSSSSPSGLSKVPFTWSDLRTRTSRPMEAVGGLLGVAQDAETMAVRPAVGWAVREADRLDLLLERLTAEHRTTAGTEAARKSRFSSRGIGANAEIARLYHVAGSAEIFGTGAKATYRLLLPSDVQTFEMSTGQTPWHVVIDLADGGRLCVYADYLFPEQLPAVRDRADLRGRFMERGGMEVLLPVWYQPARPWRRGRIVALSLVELLQRILDSNGDARWLRSDCGYGSAEDYVTHRRR